MEMISKFRILVVRFIILLLFVYLITPLLIFNLGKAGNAFDEEQYEGKKVAFGPRPRLFVCYSAYDEVNFDGTEWPFKVFYPFCRLWLKVNHYSPPSEWR